MNLKGAVCVITGAARGLGAALSRDLVEQGAHVTLSDLDSVELQNMGIELDMPTMKCDVTDREQVENLARGVIEECGHIDVWINNAGVWAPYVESENTDFNKAHLLMEVNYFGVAYGMLEAVKHMRERGSGAIVNILSVRALKGKALGAAYSASKFAAEGFTQAVRDETKDAGIRVIGFYPYRMKTELFGAHKHEDYDSSMEPTDVARIVTSELASDDPADRVEIWSPEDIRRTARV